MELNLSFYKTEMSPKDIRDIIFIGYYNRKPIIIRR